MENKQEQQIEDQLGGAGFSLSDTMPENIEEAPKALPDNFDIDMSAPVEEQAPLQNEPEPVVESAQEEQQVEPAVTEDPVVETTSDSSLNIETPVEEPVALDELAVSRYVSEKLGVEIESIDQLSAYLQQQQQQSTIDDRIKVIADFVEQTGRNPEDWFRYQALNPSEMDDMTAVRISMSNEYPSLNGEEVDMLVGSKYKLDEEYHNEDELKLSKLQLKIDADKARKGIDKIRSQYTAPAKTQEEPVKSPIDERWINNMKEQTNNLEAVTFELADGKEFEFGVQDSYRSKLIDKNTNLESYFDQYIDQKGNWDYDKFNIHQTLVDNIDAIAKSLYQQGMSDGQRKVVDQAANVQTKSPGVGAAQPTDNVSQQILDALGVDKTLKFF
jgi:hypothetical protein|tara:strand:+ start:95 stop:1252 length:1158 start_codon:yes stop_codon:yes gene_type:complete